MSTTVRAEVASALRVPRRRKELKPGEGLHLSVRLDADVAQALDGVIADLSKTTGLTVSRTDVVRLLLREALDARTKRRK
jgi:hypothetical protein